MTRTAASGPLAAIATPPIPRRLTPVLCNFGRPPLLDLEDDDGSGEAIMGSTGTMKMCEDLDVPPENVSTAFQKPSQPRAVRIYSLVVTAAAASNGSGHLFELGVARTS